ncbi:hypothetical protein ACG0Z6_12770 [Roseateles sp. BYS180W]|uniref:Uncharacterized protein n=1 Tax=Roseateles rivi TaxID=3299028 RepID=A0ABW7FXP7_9BURK
MNFVLANVRDPSPVEEQPHVPLKWWRMLRTPEGDFHILALLDCGSCRITSAIEGLNVRERSAITTSGRTYELGGPPVEQELVLLMLMTVAAHNGLGESVDVSEDMWTRMTWTSPAH